MDGRGGFWSRRGDCDVRALAGVRTSQGFRAMQLNFVVSQQSCGDFYSVADVWLGTSAAFLKAFLQPLSWLCGRFGCYAPLTDRAILTAGAAPATTYIEQKRAKPTNEHPRQLARNKVSYSSLGSAAALARRATCRCASRRREPVVYGNCRGRDLKLQQTIGETCAFALTCPLRRGAEDSSSGQRQIRRPRRFISIMRGKFSALLPKRVHARRLASRLLQVNLTSGYSNIADAGGRHDPSRRKRHQRGKM